MGFFGLGGKSSRKERAAAKAEAAKAALGSAGKQYQASKPQGKENKPNKAAKKSKDEKLRPKGSEKKTSKQATSRKDEGQLLIKKNEAMELRHSIVSDRRKSRVSTPAPTNTNATEAFSSASWKATVIAKYVESMDWVGLENMLWHVSTSVFNDTSLRKSILQEAVPQECIKAATHPRASQGVVQKAVYIVSQVSFLDEAETPLVQEGVIPMLRSILGLSTDSHTISSAVQSLRNLMGGSEKTSFQVGKEQCAIYLLQILQGSHRVVFDSIDVEVSTKRESAAAIANLTHFGPKYQNQLIRAKGVDVFMKVLSTTTDDETKYQLTKALANCALEARWHGILVAHGVILEAQRILRSCREPETVAEASRILGNIALTSAGRARIVDLGGVEELTEKLVNSASSAPAAPIPDLVNTLYNICLSERPALTACLRGAVPVLLDLALLPKSSEDTSELVRVTALNTLINISQTGQMQHVVKAFNDAAESAVSVASTPNSVRAKCM
uniref:Armadillo repeat-containing domain-containing protein n=1 Tax=Rhodosorus marinus TaxID=101924 RepID=A0A7S2ZTT6_9RHOD|mmetsp:Transcript_32419/g.127172  ORF Transcript_32419/g.127172 Transcript_32419/m.127172 type:complete len:500 (+) Transcript_32419:229-1728(+)